MLKWGQVIRRSEVEGRFVVEATHEGSAWEVVVEPDDELAPLRAPTMLDALGPA